LIFNGLQNKPAQFLLEQTFNPAQLLRTVVARASCPCVHARKPLCPNTYIDIASLNRKSQIANRKFFVTFSPFPTTYATI